MSDPAFAKNPWSAEHWNLTKQGQYVQKYGIEVAKTKAAQAGASLDGKRPMPQLAFAPIPKSNFTVIVQRKGTPAPVGGGGLVGAGSSGDGPPT